MRSGRRGRRRCSNSGSVFSPRGGTGRLVVVCWSLFRVRARVWRPSGLGLCGGQRARASAPPSSGVGGASRSVVAVGARARVFSSSSTPPRDRTHTQQHDARPSDAPTHTSASRTHASNQLAHSRRPPKRQARSGRGKALSHNPLSGACAPAPHAHAPRQQHTKPRARAARTHRQTRALPQQQPKRCSSPPTSARAPLPPPPRALAAPPAGRSPPSASVPQG